MRTDSRSLRSGYTTGACAAAVAKAAAIALREQKPIGRVEIGLPGGERVPFAVSRCEFDSNQATCSIIKDAGDDPDITDGAEICATVRRGDQAGIHVHGGQGVGKVTRPGLEVAVGESAINPVPRRMILEAVKEAMPNTNLEVTISVPEGKKLARRTLNARLGIVGGISIIGTSGVVIPYSIDAYTACISQAINVAAASGCREAVLTTGRRSEKFAQEELKLPDVCFIQSGDFIDHSLRECAAKGLAKVTVWGMIGKMTKLAAGNLYTNISDSKVDIGLLARLAKECGVSGAASTELSRSVTANQFRRLLPPEKLKDFCIRLCRLAAYKCREFTGGKVAVECIVTDPEGVILGRGNAEA